MQEIENIENIDGMELIGEGDPFDLAAVNAPSTGNGPYRAYFFDGGTLGRIMDKETGAFDWATLDETKPVIERACAALPGGTVVLVTKGELAAIL